MTEESKPNVSISISGGTFKDFVAGNKETKVEGGNYIESQVNYHGQPADAQTLAKELDELLQTLDTDPTDEAAEAITLQELDKKPTLKERLIAAITAGSITAIEELCQHPLAKVALSALKAAFPSDD